MRECTAEEDERKGRGMGREYRMDISRKDWQIEVERERLLWKLSAVPSLYILRTKSMLFQLNVGHIDATVS